VHRVGAGRQELEAERAARVGGGRALETLLVARQLDGHAGKRAARLVDRLAGDRAEQRAIRPERRGREDGQQKRDADPISSHHRLLSRIRSAFAVRMLRVQKSNTSATRARRAAHDETVCWRDERCAASDRNDPRISRIGAAGLRAGNLDLIGMRNQIFVR